MSNLNLDLNYFEHPKITRLVGLLGPGAELFPIRLWCYCGLYHTENGRFSCYSVPEIESVAKWIGESGAMVSAMVHVGLLDKRGEEYEIHDWKETNGHLIAFKIRGKKAAAKRWGRSNATSIAKRSAKQYPNQPNQPIQPNQTIPTELQIIPGLMDAWQDWEAYRREARKPLTASSRKAQWAKLAHLPDPVGCIRQSIERQWQGLFEVKDYGTNQRAGSGQGGRERHTYTPADI
jgi:hypothetical protein